MASYTYKPAFQIESQWYLTCSPC